MNRPAGLNSKETGGVLQNKNMRKAFKTTGPDGSEVTVQQLEQGEVTQAGDWYLAVGHLRRDWHRADPRIKLREFHLPHVRIVGR